MNVESRRGIKCLGTASCVDSKHCWMYLVGEKRCVLIESGSNHGEGSDAKMHGKHILVVPGRRGMDLC